MKNWKESCSSTSSGCALQDGWAREANLTFAAGPAEYSEDSIDTRYLLR